MDKRSQIRPVQLPYEEIFQFVAPIGLTNGTRTSLGRLNCIIAGRSFLYRGLVTRAARDKVPSGHA